jgi:hypothetical protein
VPRAPSPASGVTVSGATSSVASAGITPPSSLLRAHAPDQLPPIAYGRGLGRWVFAGCRQSLLGDGPSRRYLRKSFPRCLDPYPGAPHGASARFFPGGIGLPRVANGSAMRNDRATTSARNRFRGYSHSFIFRPLDLLATQVVPTAAPLGAGQPWLLRPRISQVVTSLRSGYASRLNRAIDGARTSTSPDLRPCRPLPQHSVPVDGQSLPVRDLHPAGRDKRFPIARFRLLSSPSSRLCLAQYVKLHIAARSGRRRPETTPPASYTRAGLAVRPDPWGVRRGPICRDRLMSV